MHLALSLTYASPSVSQSLQIFHSELLPLVSVDDHICQLIILGFVLIAAISIYTELENVTDMTDISV